MLTGRPVRRKEHWARCNPAKSTTKGNLHDKTQNLTDFFIFSLSLCIEFVGAFVVFLQILESKEIETLVSEIEKEKEEEAEKKKQKKSTWNTRQILVLFVTWMENHIWLPNVSFRGSIHKCHCKNLNQNLLQFSKIFLGHALPATKKKPINRS